MKSIIKKTLDTFFEKVCRQCWNESIESLVETFEIKGLTDEDIDEIDDYLEDLASDDDCDYEICETPFWDSVIGETLYLRKSIAYDLSADYCENTLSLTANFRYYYEKYGWGNDVLEISERDYSAILEEHIDDDIFDEDEDEYSGDMPCRMHHIGNGAWCDDDGDNWDFD